MGDIEELTLENCGERNPFVRRDKEYIERYEKDTFFRWRIRVQFWLCGIFRMALGILLFLGWYVVYKVFCLVARCSPKEFQDRSRFHQRVEYATRWYFWSVLKLMGYRMRVVGDRDVWEGKAVLGYCL